MNTRASANSPLDVIALGWSLSAARRAVRDLPAVALVLPEWRASHGWIGLFFCRTDDVGSGLDRRHRLSIVFGWVTAVVLDLVYNGLIRR